MKRDLLDAQVEKIQGSYVRDFVYKALEATDDDFWVCPCSGSGRFHPPEDNGEGGLIRHLIKATVVTEQFARREDFTQYETDLAIAATILHDIKKNGEPWGESTDMRHGAIGAGWLARFSLPDRTGKQIILDGVRYHMAPWNTILTPEEKKVVTPENFKLEISELKRGNRPHSIIEECVQHADYWASRKDMSYMPGINVDFSQAVHDSE